MQNSSQVRNSISAKKAATIAALRDAASTVTETLADLDEIVENLPPTSPIARTILRQACSMGRAVGELEVAAQCLEDRYMDTGTKLSGN